MSNDLVIRVEGVSKKFCRSLKRSVLYAAKDVAGDILGIHRTLNGLRRDEFWALRNVCFDVKRGECFGLIGPNGAGKSTLLKMLNGLILPDKGRITVRGRVGALLELGAGFHPMLTGRENIYLTGAALGLSKKEMDDKFEEIVDFAELWEFIDTPVKHYSSGMYVRLGFAVATNVDVNTLVVDEALAVGDALFVQKCLRKFEQLRDQGLSIVFVSHDLNSIKKHCQKAMLLDHGEIIDTGDPKEIIDVYNAIVFETIAAQTEERKNSPGKAIASRRIKGESQRYGTGEAEIMQAALLDAKGIPVGTIVSGEEGILRIQVRFNAPVKDVVVGITIRDYRGLDIYGVNTLWRHSTVEKCEPGDVVIVDFKQRMMLGMGEYTVNVAINEKRREGLKRLDWISDTIAFNVVQVEEFLGFCNLDSEISIKFV